MAEIVRRRSWGGVLPLWRHVSISGSRSIHAPSVSIAPSSFQEEQNARHHKQFKLEQALVLLSHEAEHLEAGPSRRIRPVFQHEARRCPSTRVVKRGVRGRASVVLIPVD